MTHHRQDRPKGPWTEEAILQESELWVHVPPSGVLVESAGRLMVHLPARQATMSRVWRSRPDRAEAEALILQTIEETRAAAGTRLVWHTGDAVSPPLWTTSSRDTASRGRKTSTFSPSNWARVRSRNFRGCASPPGAEISGRTLRLWGAGTLAARRGRGAYRALVMEKCRHAHALGATLALTKANTTSSTPVLRAAGFRPVATERRYALVMAARASPRG